MIDALGCVTHRKTENGVDKQAEALVSRALSLAKEARDYIHGEVFTMIASETGMSTSARVEEAESSSSSSRCNEVFDMKSSTAQRAHVSVELRSIR